MIIIDEVIVTLKLDQLICKLLHAIQIEETIIHGTILQNHLTVCAELVIACLKCRTLENLAGQVDSLIFCNLMAVIDEIITTIHLNQLISMNHEAVLIVEVVTHNTMVDHHLSICTKGVGTGRNQTVGSCGRDSSRGVLCDTAKTVESATDAAQIVSTIDQVDTGLGHAALDDVVVAIELVQAVGDGLVLVGSAVLAEIVPVSGGIGVILDEADAGVHIGIGAEIVGLAVQFDPHTGVELGAVAVTGASGIGRPCTLGAAVFVEDIGDAANGLRADIQLVVSASVAVALVGGLPAGLQLAIDGVVQVAVHLEDAGAGLIDLATALIDADELAALDLIVVIQLLQDGSPIHDGLTGLAVGTVLVTCGVDGRLLIQDRQLGIMDMIGRGNGGQLGSDADLTAEGLAVDDTVNDLTIDIDNRLVAHVSGLIVGVIDIVVTVEDPDTDGNADQSLSLSLASVLQFNSDGQQFGNLVVLERSNIAVSNDSTLGLPSVGIVQLQDSGHRLGRRQVSHIDVHIVDGLSLGSLAGIIVTGQDYSSLTGDGEGTGQAGRITQLVLDLEGDGVGTGNQNHILLGGQSAAIDGSLDLDAIHEDLAGSQIQSEVIGNSGGEGEVGAGDGGTVLQGNSGVRVGVSGVGNNGQHSVVHGGGVIQSDVVDVEGHDVSSLRLDISTDEGRRTGVARIGSHGSAEVVVLGDVDGGIDPAGLGNICIGGGVQVGQLAGGSRSEHEVILLAGVGAVCILHKELRLEGQTLTGGGECILGDVQPHAQAGGLHAVGHITQDDGLTGVEQNIIRPACKGSIGVVQSPGQGILTITNLTTLLQGGGEGIAAQVLVELTGQRIGTNQGVVDTVVDGPLLGLLEAHEAGLVAVLKVEDDFGTLAELDGIDQLNVVEGDGDNDTGNVRVAGGGEGEAIQNTGSLVGQSHGDSVGINIDIAFAGHGDDGQSDGANLLLGGVGHHSGGSGQLENLRNSNGDGLGTDHCAAGDHLNVHGTHGAIGNESAVLDGSEGIIGQSPGSIGGHLHGVAVGVDSLSAEGVLGVGCEDVVLGGHIHHIQDAGGGNIGCNEDAMSGGTLSAVTGNGTHGEGILTDTLGQEGGGTAAVTVGSPLTAQGQHGFAFLVVAEADRVVGSAAVIHTDDQSAILLDADHGTGGTGTTANGGVGQLAILDDHVEQDTHSVEQNALLHVGIKFSLDIFSHITGDIALLVLENIQDGLGALGLMHANVLAVVDQNTGCIGIVVQVGVHTADDVVTEILLVVSSHVGQFLMGPVGLIGRILGDLVDLVITGNDGDIGIGGVNLDDVQNLSAGTGSVVEDDLGLNRSAGNQNVILFRDHIVIAIGAKGGAIINNIRLSPVGNRRKYICGNEAQKHHNRQQHSHYALCHCFLHFRVSFARYYIITNRVVIFN